jgi:putative acetyltransferase
VNDFEIERADPRDERVRELVERHLAFGRSFTPLEDAHALEVDELIDPAIVLLAARAGAEVLAIGAIKEIEPGRGELKTMHTAEAARGRGVGRAMLGRLLAEARRGGYRRVSLETGTMDAFAPARALYESAGFTPCEPFGTYRGGPHNVFLTLDLDGDDEPGRDRDRD